MNRSISNIVLIALLFVGRFGFAKDKEAEKFIEMDAMFSEVSMSHCFLDRNRTFLIEYGNVLNRREFLLLNLKDWEGHYYYFENETIQNIPRHFTVKIVGKLEIENCQNENRTYEVCKIVKHSPIKYLRNYKLDTSVTYNLFEKWKFIGLKNSVDSMLIDGMRYGCCEPYKFETYNKNDSIFYPPTKNGFGLKFEKNIRNPLTDLDNYYVDRGCNRTYDGYCIFDNNRIEFHRECFNILSGGCLNEEIENYQRLFTKAFYSTKKYSLNHNILKLYDNNTTREMIFIRDEK